MGSEQKDIYCVTQNKRRNPPRAPQCIQALGTQTVGVKFRGRVCSVAPLDSRSGQGSLRADQTKRSKLAGLSRHTFGNLWPAGRFTGILIQVVAKRSGGIVS